MTQRLDDAVREHRRQIVTARWGAGATAGQIAKELGVTRNIVTSIIHRQKLPKRSQDATRQQGRVNTAKQQSKPKGFAMPMVAGLGLSVAKDKTPPVKARKDNLQPIGLVGDFPSDRTTCRFIYDKLEGGQEDWALCGREGYPYCVDHKKRMHQPSTGKSNIDPKVIRASGINRALG